MINNRWKKIERFKGIYLPTLPKIPILNKNTKVCLMGSCFADEIGYSLAANNINIGEVEFDKEMKVVKYPWGTFFSPVNIYNILEITKLLTYAESLWNQQFIPFINLNLLQTPNYLGIQHLSKNLKLEAIKKLEHYSKTSNYIKQDKAHSENIHSIITYLKKPVNNEKQGLIKFKKFNDMLDQKRKVQLADYVPNLAKQL